MGKRKVNAVVAGKARVNRIMRENNLLSPNRRPGKTTKREHDGTIITDAPNVMWATDGKKFWIENGVNQLIWEQRLILNLMSSDQF